MSERPGERERECVCGPEPVTKTKEPDVLRLNINGLTNAAHELTHMQIQMPNTQVNEASDTERQ